MHVNAVKYCSGRYELSGLELVSSKGRWITLIYPESIQRMNLYPLYRAQLVFPKTLIRWIVIYPGETE